MFPILLTKKILQESLSSVDDPDRLFDLCYSIKKFTLVCKQWRLSVVPLLSFETPIDSVLEEKPNHFTTNLRINHMINELLDIGFRYFNVKFSYYNFEELKNADEEERVQKKRLDQLKAFRDNTTIMRIDFSKPIIIGEEINDYIDLNRLKMLNYSGLRFPVFGVGSSQVFKISEYLSSNSFPELRDLVMQDIGIVHVNWSFPTMPQLESLHVSYTKLSGDELDIIFSRVKVIKISGIYNSQPLVLSHLERSTVVSHFTMTESSDYQFHQIFQQLDRLLNSNNTLKSLNIQSHYQLEDLGLYNDLPSIHNTTLESFTLTCDSDQDLREPFTKFFSKWTGSNLKTLVAPHLIYSNFTSNLAQEFQSSFPKLEKISFHDGDINVFKSYILSNHNLKTLTFCTINPNPILGCLHSIRDLTFHILSVDSFIQILSMQSPRLKSLEVIHHLSSHSFLEISESLALSIRDNQHLTHLSFRTPMYSFSNPTQLIRFLTSIIEGNRSLLSLDIGYTIDEADSIDPTQFNLFKQSVISNHTIQTLKISHHPFLRLLDFSMPALEDFIKSQSINTKPRAN